MIDCSRIARDLMVENVLGGVMAVVVLIYLLWALLEPERF